MLLNVFITTLLREDTDASLLATLGNAALQAAEVKARLVTSTPDAFAEKPPSAAIWLKPFRPAEPSSVG
jgi:hypothetical protein